LKSNVDMGYKVSGTTCVVRLVPLTVNRDQAKQCEALRQEAGRCWSDMVAAHVASRSGPWLSANDLMHEFKGGYALHSQLIQALAQKLEYDVQTTRERRSNGDKDIEYPYRPKEYQTVTWKDQAIRVREGWIILSNGRGRDPLILLLPAEYRSADIRKAELLWHADHYELALTLDSSRRRKGWRTLSSAMCGRWSLAHTMGAIRTSASANGRMGSSCSTSRTRPGAWASAQPISPKTIPPARAASVATCVLPHREGGFLSARTLAAVRWCHVTAMGAPTSAPVAAMAPTARCTFSTSRICSQ
jgi:putative transposase